MYSIADSVFTVSAHDSFGLLELFVAIAKPTIIIISKIPKSKYVAQRHFLPRTLSELHRLYMKSMLKVSFRINYGQFSFTFDTIKTASMIVIRHMNVTPFSRATHPQQHLGPLMSSDIEIVLF